MDKINNREPGWMYEQIKMRWNGLEWQKVDPGHDIFDNFDKVAGNCNQSDMIQEGLCWMDAYNWSIMNKSKITEDIYQVITYNAGKIQKGFRDEIKDFEGIDWEFLMQSFQFIGGFL